MYHHQPGDGDVVIIHWPADEDRRRRLAKAGVARMLVIPPGEPAPVAADALEDWVRVPADPEEVIARVDTLRRRLARRRAATVPAVLDESGLVRRADRWAAVPPIEQAIIRCLLAHDNVVVERRRLIEAAWGGEPHRDPAALDHRIKALRGRVEPLGIAIHTVAGRGYLLEHTAMPEP